MYVVSLFFNSRRTQSPEHPLGIRQWIHFTIKLYICKVQTRRSSIDIIKKMIINNENNIGRSLSVVSKSIFYM